MAIVDYRSLGEAFGMGLGPLDPTVPMGFIGYSQPTSTSATLTFEDGSVFRMKSKGLRPSWNGTGGWDLVGVLSSR